MFDRFGRFELDIDDAHRLTRRTIEDDGINRILKPILWPRAPKWLYLEMDYETRTYAIITEETKIKPVSVKDILLSGKEILSRLDEQKWREAFIQNQP